MRIEEAVMRRLRDTCLQTTANPAERIHYIRAPDPTAADYITIQRIDSVPGHTLTGLNGLKADRFQINCVSSTVTGARAVAGEVRAALDDFSGVMGGAGGVDVAHCALDDEHEEFGYDARLFLVSVDYIIRYKE